MLLLSLGSGVLVTLLQSGHRDMSAPDLSWLLFGPDLPEATPSCDISSQLGKGDRPPEPMRGAMRRLS